MPGHSVPPDKGLVYGVIFSPGKREFHVSFQGYFCAGYAGHMFQGHQVGTVNPEKIIAKPFFKGGNIFPDFIFPFYGVDGEVVQEGFRIQNIRLIQPERLLLAGDDQGGRFYGKTPDRLVQYLVQPGSACPPEPAW